MGAGALGMAGIETAQNVVNAGMGLILQRSQDKRQMNMARKLQRLQMEGDKEMTNYNMAKQLEMWKSTSYPAQMEMLKQAGLNPGLLYGMGGGGGATANIESGRTSTGGAPVGGGEVAAMMGMGIQRELLQAQKENIQADTKLKEANVPKTQAETSSLLQGIENAKAQKELTDIQASIARVEDYVKGKTQNLQVSYMQKIVAQAQETLDILENDKEISEATVQEKVDLVRLEVLNAYLNGIKTQADTDKTRQEIEKLANDIQVANKTVNIQAGKLALETAIADGTIINWKGGALDVIKRIVGSWLGKGKQ